MGVVSNCGSGVEKCKTAHLSSSVTTLEKHLSDNYRDALTHFAAAFSSLDGYNLRRSLGKRIELLVDAIIEDPMVMVIPRHLLAFNRISSFEFCNILMDFLCDRIHLLAKPKNDETVSFLDESQLKIEEDDTEILSPQMIFEKQLYVANMGPSDSVEKKQKLSSTILHLFERVLKSFSSYPENEVVVRRHLRRIVVLCFQSAMENTEDWPENYCMLLRYIFRSISAGKFEESYKELLPLIPSVLNGLYRVLVSTSYEDNKSLRYTAIELCLTIPARLSSLLPHISLLLRIIIPALDSNSGDLINLG
jgi:transformation/transcription domain-associated protein